MNRYWIGALSVALLGVSSAWAEQVYRWTDESGQVHFSNAGPAGEDDSSSSGEAAPAAIGEPAPAVQKSADSPYGGLSGDSFSSVVSRKRGEMRRELGTAKRRIQEIDERLASLKQTRDETFQQYATNLQGVTRPEFRASDEEKDLLKERKKLEKEIESIRASFDEMKAEATSRNGGTTPGWWLPLD